MISMDMKYTALYWALRFVETELDVHVPPQRDSNKDYHGITCEKHEYLAKKPKILRIEPTSSQKTMNRTIKTMHQIALVFALGSCIKNA